MIAQEDIRNELARVIESSLFVQSDRLARFLRFTIETTLEGKGDTLKEYLIGTAVYDRKSDYHPSEDSIVRSEARRLRRKLQEYYQSIGKDDPVFIYYRPGSYVPVFRGRNGHDSDASPCVIASEADRTESVGIRISVAPLVDLSPNPSSGNCAQFITDELIHALVRTEGLRVTAAGAVGHSVESFDRFSLANKLGVQLILEGTVCAEGSRLRTTLRLVSADGFHLWSERFDTGRDTEGLFAAAERIASALVNRLEPEQLVGSRRRTPARPMLNVYSQVLRAEASLDAGSLADAQAALSKFEAITASEPDYPRSLCGIAVCKCEMALQGAPDSGRALRRAREVVERAAKLDPQMTLAQASMGLVLGLEWNWRDAENTFQQALGLGEHAGTYLHYALFLASLGRFDESWSYIQRGHRIDPFSHRQKLAYTKLFFLSRNYEQGLEHISQQLVYGPLPIESEIHQAMMLASINRRDEARKLVQCLPRKSGAQPVIMSGIAEVLAMCGEYSAARRIAGDYNLFSANSPVSHFRQALLSAALGSTSQAISLLGSAYEKHEPELIWLSIDPRLDLIRDDPRYSMIMNDVMSGSMEETAA